MLPSDMSVVIDSVTLLACGTISGAAIETVMAAVRPEAPTGPELVLETAVQAALTGLAVTYACAATKSSRPELGVLFVYPLMYTQPTLKNNIEGSAAVFRSLFHSAP